MLRNGILIYKSSEINGFKYKIIKNEYNVKNEYTVELETPNEFLKKESIEHFRDIISENYRFWNDKKDLKENKEKYLFRLNIRFKLDELFRNGIGFTWNPDNEFENFSTKFFNDYIPILSCTRYYEWPDKYSRDFIKEFLNEYKKNKNKWSTDIKISLCNNAPIIFQYNDGNHRTGFLYKDILKNKSKIQIINYEYNDMYIDFFNLQFKKNIIIFRKWKDLNSFHYIEDSCTEANSIVNTIDSFIKNYPIIFNLIYNLASEWKI